MKFDIRTLPPEYQKLFIADACRELPKPIRSPWLDYEEKRRRGNKRDYFSNVWGVCVGSSDSVFDQIVLEKIKNTTIRYPDYSGEIVFDYENDKVTEGKFKLNFGRQRFQWWGELIAGRPNQNHNYIGAFDISYGLGSSNSVMQFYDCNTQEQVAEWADPFTRENDFADLVVATAKWVGGSEPCFLIWEDNGGQATIFGQRILYQNYYRIYVRKKEDAKYRKKADTYGWRSSRNPKAMLLSLLGTALSCGINNVKNSASIKIHSKDLLDELFDYIWYEGGDCGTSKTQDLKTGARKRHGDRVIPVGLCVLATRDQPEGTGKKIVSIPANSFLGRFQQWIDKQEERNRNSKIWFY